MLNDLIIYSAAFAFYLFRKIFIPSFIGIRVCDFQPTPATYNPQPAIYNLQPATINQTPGILIDKK